MTRPTTRRITTIQNKINQSLNNLYEIQDELIPNYRNKDMDMTIYCSDVGKILGLSDYSDSFSVMCDRISTNLNRVRAPKAYTWKRHGMEKNSYEKDASTHGKIYEVEAKRLYTEMTGQAIHKVELYSNGIFSGIPDGILENGKFVETKCPFYGLEFSKRVPDEYYAQIQTYLHLFDKQECDYVEFIRQKIKIIPVKRDEEWMQEQLPKLMEFRKQFYHYQKYGIETHPVFQTRDQFNERIINS